MLRKTKRNNKKNPMGEFWKVAQVKKQYDAKRERQQVKNLTRIFA